MFFVFVFFSALEALTFPPTQVKSFNMGTNEGMESVLGLGELAGLTVANEADGMVYDVSEKRKHWTLNLCLKSIYSRILK